MDEVQQAIVAQRGRPRIPASEKKITVSTSLDQATYAAIQAQDWRLCELIMDGTVHRGKCAERDKTLLEAVDTIRLQNEAIDKLNADLEAAYERLGMLRSDVK